MARAATTTDVFNAIAEPRRRQILDVLAAGERSVNELVELLNAGQPHISKHLRVLREVGLVDVRDDGRHRWYRLNPQALQPLIDWITPYEQLWNDRFDALDALLERQKESEEDYGSTSENRNSRCDPADADPNPDHPGV